MEHTDSGEDDFEDGLLAEKRGIECVVTSGIMIMSPMRSMGVDDTEPERTLTKLPTYRSWSVCGNIENAGEVEVECDEAAVLRVDGYKIECDIILCYMSLEGNVCRPNIVIKVEVDVDTVEIKCRKVEGEGWSRISWG